MSTVRAMLAATQLPHCYWGEALLHVAQSENRTALQPLKDKTLFEVLYGTISGHTCRAHCVRDLPLEIEDHRDGAGADSVLLRGAHEVRK